MQSDRREAGTKMTNKGKKSECLLVFGSSGRVGTAIVSEAKSRGMYVIGIGRKKNRQLDYHVQTDMVQFESVANLTEDVFNEFKPKSVVFAHRSRENKSDDAFSNTVKGLTDSLLPIYVLRYVLERSTQTGDISIVAIGSTASYSYSNDTEISYHVNKAAMNSAVLMLGYINSTLRIFSNLVLFGEAKDMRVESDSEYHARLYSDIGMTLNKSVATIQSISRLCVLLAASAVDLQISGQELRVDSGLSRISIESLFRRAAKGE